LDGWDVCGCRHAFAMSVGGGHLPRRRATRSRGLRSSSARDRTTDVFFDMERFGIVVDEVGNLPNGVVVHKVTPE